MARPRILFSLLLTILFCLPALAQECPAIQSLTAGDVQTGEPVTINWSYANGVLPQSQTLTGHDFPVPLVLPPSETSFTYYPVQPGEKHVQLAAVSSCGTVARTTKYHVKQCNVVAAPIVVDQSSVAPGGVVTASIALQPGQTAKWDVVNGTASATSGASIQVTAGATGPIAIGAWVSRGSSCAVRVTASVAVVEACGITEPQIYSPPVAIASSYFGLYVPTPPGSTVTFTVTGAAEIYWNDGVSLDLLTPASGSFTVNITVSNGTCSRTFSRTWEVGPCTAAATVSAGEGGSCGASTAVLELAGVAPFQGMWSDGEYFYTDDNRIERPLTAAGVYTISYFYDATFCQGTITGSATAGAAFPPPSLTIDPWVGSSYYANVACPGQERVANLTSSVPAGAQLEWSVTNATILSGQGTSALHFVAGTAGPISVTATLRDAQGCSQSSTDTSLLVYGTPAFNVTVEPSTIPLGGTAIITVTQVAPFTGGIDVTSSLGDQIIPLGGTGESARWEYRASNGGGTATITVTETNQCLLTTTVQTPVTIDAEHPVQATAAVRAIGSGCPDYAAFAEFTGVAPFSGTWSDGSTFNDVYPYAFLSPPTGGTYTLVAFQDANGPGTITGSATFDFTRLPAPEVSFDQQFACAGCTITATLTTPVPDGATVNWTVYGATIISGQGTSTLVMQNPESWGIQVGVNITAPGACSREVYNFLPPTPSATATLTSTPDPVCGAILTVTFTGAPPFTGTWSDTGETFTTSSYTYTRNVGTTSMYVYVYNVSDANGSGNGSNSVLVQATLPPYVYPDGDSSVCVGQTGTARSYAPIPEGWEIIWHIEGSNASIVSGQGTGEMVFQVTGSGSFHLGARYRTPNGCDGLGSGYVVNFTPPVCP